jgi:protein ImuA
MDRQSMLAALRARIGRLERAGLRHAQEPVPLAEEIDAQLPGSGLARAGLHEVLAADTGAATGFCAMVLGRTGGTVLWIGPEPDAWPPGLARFGLSPAQLVFVRAPRGADALWAMEEALRCPAVSGALLMTDGVELTAARRLQLAAEAGGGLGLLLRPDTEEDAPSATLTRWRITGLASTGGAPHELGDPRWQLDLLRCRGGTPATWRTTWRTTLDRLDLDQGGEAAEAKPRAARRRR